MERCGCSFGIMYGRRGRISRDANAATIESCLFARTLNAPLMLLPTYRARERSENVFQRISSLIARRFSQNVNISIHRHACLKCFVRVPPPIPGSERNASWKLCPSFKPNWGENWMVTSASSRLAASTNYSSCSFVW